MCKISPELTAHPVSKLFRFWLLPLLRKGTRKDLTLEDVYDSPPQYSCKLLGPVVEREWMKEVTQAGLEGRPAQLWIVIKSMFWKVFVLSGILYAFDELVLRPLQPQLLKRLLQTFSLESTHVNSEPSQCQFLYASALVLVTFVHLLTFQIVYSWIFSAGMKAKYGVSWLIFQKILRLHKTDQENCNVGKLSTLLSKDVAKIEKALASLHFVYIGPLQFFLYSFFLWQELGVSCLGGLVGVLATVPLQFLLRSYSMYFATQISQRTEERGRFLNEFVVGVRLIKMYAWEKPFAKLVGILRKKELKFLERAFHLKGLYASVKSMSPKVIPFLALMPYVAMGNRITADKAFFAIAMFDVIMQVIVARVPRSMATLGEITASLDRIQKFLLSPDTQTNLGKDVSGRKGGIVTEPSVHMRNYTASWSMDRPTLQDITVDIKGNKLVIIVGHVGCGKSSFLSALISELPIISPSSQLSVTGRISYASQDAWIFPASIRENILFGLDMEEDKYWRVIKACGLSQDFKMFPSGDMTLVGERGIALSGGQKARVNLARAVYQDADIYLLDDPLSAVDMKVSKLLFNECVKKYLHGKLRILVTHQLQYLPMADHIIVLNRAGELWGQGTYEQLKNGDINFTSLIGDNYFKGNQDKADESTIVAAEDNAKTFSIFTPKPKEEKKAVGSVSLLTYVHYIAAGGSNFAAVLLITLFLLQQIVSNFVDYFIALWSNSVHSEGSPENGNYFVYCGLIVAFMIICVSRSCLFFSYCMKISMNLHDFMFGSLSRAPVKFFDDNPSGRILNRFTKDLCQIDETLPVALFDFLNVLLRIFGMVVVTTTVNSGALGLSILFLFVLWKLRKIYLGTSRDLSRIAATVKSPIMTHVTMTVQGLSTVRALQAEKRMTKHFENILDLHTSVNYMLFETGSWFTQYLELSCVALLALVTFGFVTMPTAIQSGSVGVAISTVLNLAPTLQWGVKQSAETEKVMTSVERVLEYANLKPEAPLERLEDTKLSKNWPAEGKITFDKISLAYDDANEHPVLKNVSFSVTSQEKVGIVGRTGAGKSSLFTALFRLTEPCNGTIKIDDLPTQQIGLHTLRSRVSVIPQDPVLFTGTLRYNLDPFNDFEDEELWKVLKQVDLHHAVQSLDFRVADGGGNFSVGQRQLVCLARALLRKNKILAVDEATANCDPATDKLVQNTIRSKFSDCTILTIAHRLETVLDNDRILVLDEGRVVEFDTPQNLRNNSEGYFSKLLSRDTASSQTVLASSNIVGEDKKKQEVLPQEVRRRIVEKMT